MEKKEKLTKECEICKLDANCLCYKCNNYYCEKCFKVIHDRKKNPEHKKEMIDYFIPIDLKCPNHIQFPMYLFCIDEKGKSEFY